MYTPTTDRLLDEYFLPADVSKKWLTRLRRLIKGSDYWQTGRDLWESKRVIITNPLEHHSVRGPRAPHVFMPPVMCGDFCRG